jgi:hypothetical protein
VSKQSTEQLIHDLVEEVPPVRRIPALRSVMMGVVAVWAIAVALMWIFGMPLLDFVRDIPWGDPKFVSVLVGLSLIAVGATLAALATAVPGRENVASAGGGAALLGIAIAAGVGLWTAFGAVPWGAEDLSGCVACMNRAGALALLPVFVASLFLARGFARHPILGAGSAVAGAVALGGIVVHISCRAGGALHLLLGHALAPLFLGFALAVPIGLLVRHWSRRA